MKKPFDWHGFDMSLSILTLFGNFVASALMDASVFRNIVAGGMLLGLVCLSLTSVFRKYYAPGCAVPKTLKITAVILRAALLLSFVLGGAYIVLGHDLYQDKLTH